MKHLCTALIFGFLFTLPAYSETSIEQLLSEQDVAVFTQGSAIYNKHCMACHAASNIMVASPKFGNRKDWGARLADNKTLKATVKSATKGKGAMPPKGLCVECKSKDLEAAILYMMKGEN